MKLQELYSERNLSKGRINMYSNFLKNNKNENPKTRQMIRSKLDGELIMIGAISRDIREVLMLQHNIEDANENLSQTTEDLYAIENLDDFFQDERMNKLRTKWNYSINNLTD